MVQLEVDDVLIAEVMVSLSGKISSFHFMTSFNKSK